MDIQKKSYLSTNVIVALIIGLVVGFGIGWYARQGKLPKEAAVSNPSQVAAPAGAFLPSDQRITVSDQPAGDTVLVDRAVLTQESWVAVREKRDNVLGVVLGARRRGAGEYRDLPVPMIIRPTEAGRSYAVVIYFDDGDLAFDYKKDKLLELDGKPFAVSFNAN